jgi:uncharacterized membrane protein
VHNRKSRDNLLSIFVAFGLLLQYLVLPAGAMPAAQEISSRPGSDPSDSALSSQVHDVLDRPLAISRSQSTFDATAAPGNVLTVTFTVHNNLPPLDAPQLDPGATVTETVAALAAFDYGQDPNRLRHVLVTDELLAGAVFLSADPVPDQSGNRLIWNLGDLAPYQEKSITLRLQIPASAPDFTELDSGAAAWASHQGRSVSAGAGPVLLAPDGFAAELVCTVDANCADPYILAQAAALGDDPAELFTFVRDLGYEAYIGSLRGARGALWSAAGNAADQSSLLIALLRASGIPARYRQGTLATADAQVLINSMFPAATGASGTIPAGEPVAAPAESQLLQDEARAHWWVEAYLPGQGWTAMDPSFAAAGIGDTFTAPQGPPVNELPDALHHKVAIQLRVEANNPFAVSNNSIGLSTSTPLSFTFTMAELVGEPVSLANLVSTDNPGGLVFATVEHTYVPYLVIGTAETLYEGQPYHELLTNFPLASTPITAQWLVFQVIAPDGTVETTERELFDFVGYEQRQAGGAVQINIARGTEPVLSSSTAYTTLFSPSQVSLEALNTSFQQMVAAVQDGKVALDAVDAALADGAGPEDWEALTDARLVFGRGSRLAQRLMLFKFAAVSDYTADAYGQALLVKPYPDSPRIWTISWEEDVLTGAGRLMMDLRRDDIRTLAYPGQTLVGLSAFNTARGMFEMSLESELLEEVGTEPVISVANVFAAAESQSIPLAQILVTGLDYLETLAISDEAKARITAHLQAHPTHVVVVPTASPLLGGEEAIGWLQLDVGTGEVIDVMENGQHMVAVEYATLLNSTIQEIGFAMAGFAHGYAAYTFAWLGGFFGALPLQDGDVAAAKASATAEADALTEQLQQLIEESGIGNDEWRDAYLGGVVLFSISIEIEGFGSHTLYEIKVGGFGNGVAAAQAVIGGSDPPLPPALLTRFRPRLGMEVARAAVPAGSTLSGTAINGNLTAGALALTGTASGDWTAAGRHALAFEQLSAPNGQVYGPGGVLLGSGPIAAVSLDAAAVALTSNTPLSFNVSGQTGTGLYAPATPGLAGAAGWRNHLLQLSAGQPYTLTVTGAEVTVNNNTFTGTLDIALNVPADLSGSGLTAVPSFATTADYQPAAAGLMVGPAGGSLTVGGSPVNPAGGFALGNFSGQVSVTELNATEDTVVLSGAADFFALSLSPATASTPLTGTVIFQTGIEANLAGTYTMTVFAPAGWMAAVTPNGQVSLTPALDTAPGDYGILVSAQSNLYPDLFATAVHTVTVTPSQGVALNVQVDALFTLPWGPVLKGDVLGGTNNGQVQLPGAIFGIAITNTSTVSHTFAVDVIGLPAGWSILNGQPGTSTIIDLPAGGGSWLGLVISPTTLLPVGADYPFVVTVTDQDGAGLSKSDDGLFTMPAVPFNFLIAGPETVYTTPNSSVNLAVQMANVGNSAASFPLTATLPIPTWLLSGLQSPVSLDPGQAVTQAVTLQVNGGTLGERYPVRLSSPASGEYTQRTAVTVELVSQEVGTIFDTAGQMAGACTLGEPALSAAVETLALAVLKLQASCAAGSCSLALRDAAVDAAESVALYAGLTSPLITADTTLQSLAATLSSHTSNADIEADLVAISGAVEDLGGQVCELSEHLPALRWMPSYGAALPGQVTTYTLELTNQGSLTTTYALTVALPAGNQVFSTTLAPGQSQPLVYPVSATELGLETLQATVVASGPDVSLANLAASATASLNVVERFVQLTSVTASPAFVETGVSSTTLSIDVSNVANVPLAATAHLELLAPGGVPAYTTDVPVAILVGAPRSYELVTIDTSGWAAGVYTATVDLLDGSSTLIPDGHGFGYLGVGQALGAVHATSPVVVAPGTVTVTTIITTELLVATVQPQAAQPLVAWPQRPLLSDEPLAEQTTEPGEGRPAPEDETPPADAVPLSRPSLLTTWAITRTEDSDPAVTYSGTWTPIADASAFRASNGDYTRSQTAGDVASFSFSGTWAAVGFVTSTDSGYAEIFVDGASQGLVDLYSRIGDIKRVTLAGLADTAHVITVTVSGTQNPFSTNDRVGIDYFDTWDGTTMPDGSYEENDGRVWLSSGWANQVDPNASGGSYYRNGQTAWFPFTGDSITFQGMTSTNAEKIAIYLDDDFRGYYSLYDFTVHTTTLTFDGLGAGPHVMTVRAYRGQATIDVFTTPASGPATQPPVIGSFHRYEENDPAVFYNGFPFTQTTTTWFSEFNDAVSDHYAYRSGNPGDTAALTFDGTAVGVGFYADRFSGYAEIFLDGVSQGVYDLYRRDAAIVPVYFHNLPAASHTISVTVLGQANPYATSDDVYIDYFDVWDGVPLPDGTFEELDDRVYRSFRWSLLTHAQASGGQYLQDGITSLANVWFPFTGDTVSFRAMASSQGSQWARVSIDGQPLAEINLYSNTTVSRTYSFDGLGSGLHVLQLSRYRGELAVDSFTTPGSGPFYQTAVYTGVVRYEEDDPALLYNGLPYDQRKQSWSEEALFEASSRYAVLSTTAGDTVSLTFDGRWVSAGFVTNQFGGQAEIFIDGVSQGTVGLYSANADVESFTVGGLLTGTHTISITVLGLPDPPSSQSRVYLDYVDVWDGQPMANDVANADMAAHNGRIHFSTLLSTVSHPNAIDGDYVVNSAGNPEANVWYAFTGDSFTFYGFSNTSGTPQVDVFVDNQFIDTVDLLYPFTTQPIARHFAGFGEGAHVVRISNNQGIRVDAFASNQPPVGFQPLAEWWESDRSGGGSIWGGLHSSIAAGDVNGDGLVELAIPSSNIDNNGELFLMRGDGQDTGDGDPIIWSVPFNIFNGFEDVGSVAIAELDGQPGAEIVMATVEGMYAFHSDGSTYWFTDTVKPHVFFGTPAIGNLDLDPEPEIAINMNQTMVVFEQDGTIAWTFNHTSGLAMPLLADLTGDGMLDILFHDLADTLYLFDYGLGTPQLVWTAVFTNALQGYGAPAVADLDLDGTPEVAVATANRLFALNSEDGSIQWSAPLDPGTPGGVTIADIDGDGFMELVTSSLYNGGTLYAFEADGTLKWAVPALDSSPLNTSAADLDGDGAAELLWNGINQGFTIYDGRTGNILFNEPLVKSATGSDVPVAVDVDLDGYTEVIVPAQGGIRVFGFDGVWGPGRPLWNQLNYHITNINDDLSVPFSEVNSWNIHNSYRTQWPDSTSLPVFAVTVSHTVGITGVAVLTGTFSVPPDTTADPLYGWDYAQTWLESVVTRAFASELADMRPGETRLVAQGTEVVYTLPSGSNRLLLPPLYASAAHIISLEPVTQSVGIGGQASFSLALSNPGATAETYSLSLGGLPAGWATLPPTVTVSAGGEVILSLDVTVPPEAAAAELPLVVVATTSSGGVDQAGATLTVFEAVSAAIAPAARSTTAGVPVTYTLTISNHAASAVTYDLVVLGLVDASLPPTVTVATGSALQIPVTISASAAGPHPFTVLVSGPNGQASTTALVDVNGSYQPGVTLDPAMAVAGSGSPALFTVTVANLGSLPDTIDLSVLVPAGWDYALTANGVPVSSLTLTPQIFDTADLDLAVTPAVGTTPGSYPVGVLAQSQSQPAAQSVVSGTVEVLNLGVQVAVSPISSTLDPTATAVWQVTVTNTGSVADSYWLTATNLIGLAGQFSTNPLPLSPGQAQIVQLSADDLDFALPATYPFSVVAESQADNRIRHEAQATVTFTGYEGVQVGWLPPSQTVTNTLSATFLMVITNTGNVATTFEFALAAPLLTGQLPVSELTIPAHMVAALPVTVEAPGAGTYALEGTATTAGGGASDSSLATLTVVVVNLPPTATAGPDQTADEGSLVSFNGSAGDPEGDPLQIAWDFGDGSTASGTLTPTHTYADDGPYVVTLVVTDSVGQAASDTLLVTVTNVAPAVAAGPDQTADEGVPVNFNGSFTDPGILDTHTIEWEFGDGGTAAGTLTPTHTFTDPGFYTVTLTVTDDDGGLGSDWLHVTVNDGTILVNPGPDLAADEGDTIVFSGVFTDTGGPDTYTILWDFGDGGTASGTLTPTHVYADDDVYTVTLTILAADGSVGGGTLLATIGNADPVVDAGPDQTVDEGELVLLAPATFSDPGTADTHTAEIDWGDGTIDEGMVNQAAGTVSGSHTYVQPGVYTVTVTVFDDDGGQHSDTFTVTVLETGHTIFLPLVARD